MEPFRFLAEFGFKRFCLARFLDFGNYGLDFGFLLDFCWIFCRVYEDFLSEMPLDLMSKLLCVSRVISLK